MQLKGWKRCMAALLAVMCVFTSVNVTAFAATGIGTNNSGVWGVTAAQLVASRYDGDEADVITSPAINSGEAFEARLPEGDLVSVNTVGTECTITANDYVAGGETWKPDRVEVKDAETDAVLGVSEDWTSNAGVNTAVVTLPDNTASYYASVVYVWDVTLDSAEEERLLNVAAQLVEAKQSMDAVVELEYDLESLNSVFATVQGKISDLPVKPEAVQKLSNKIAAAEDAVDVLLGWIGDYAETDFEAAYHWENGAEIKAAANQAWEDIDSLYQNVIDNEDALAQAMGSAVIGSFVSNLENLVYEDPANESDNGYLTEVKNAEWSFLAFDPGFTGTVDANLDAIVAGMADAEVADAKGTYTVASEVVSYEVNVTRVYITLKATIASDEAVDFEAKEDAAYETLDNLTATILMPAGTAKAVVEEKINAKVEELIAAWEDYGITDSAKFDVDVDGIIPDVLTEDIASIDWTVTCTPKMFDVTFVGATTETKAYPYGTFVYLTEHEDPEQSWDYSDGTFAYAQGDSILVDEDVVISRQKLPAVKDYRVADVLAEDTQYNLNDNEKAILTSPALISDGMGYRLPSSTNASIELDEVEQKYVVTATTASAGTNVTGEWEPVKVQIMNGKTVIGTVDLDDGVGEWYVDAYPSFTNVNVVFEYAALEAETALYYLNLPYELKQNVEVQKDLLVSDDPNEWTAEKIYGYFTDDVMEFMTKEYLNTLKMMLGRDAQAAVNDILNNGWSEVANEPAVYSNLKAADGENWNFSKCVEKGYYANICDQVGLFARNMDAIVNDGNFNAMLKTAGYEAKQDQIDDLCEALDELDQRIQDNPLHEAFDQDNGAFAALVDTIDKANDLHAYATANGISAYAKTLLAKPGSVTLTINVMAEKQAGKFVSKQESIVVEKGNEISAATINAEIAELEAALGLTTSVKKFYDASAIDGFTGGAMVADALTEKVWTLKEFVVSVEGAEDKVLRYGDKLYVDLPQSIDPNYAYKYYVGGVEITDPSGKYWFENEDLLTKFVDGKFEITREVIDKKVETFESFIDSMNDALGSLKDSSGKPMATFVPVKNAGGEYESVVLRLSASKDLNTTEVMKAVAGTLVGLSYNYIGMEKELGARSNFKYEEDGAVKMNPQALIDLILNGGVSTESLLKLIKADGSVNAMTLPGYDGYLGGKLIESKIYLGNDADDCEALNFYITLNPADKAMLRDFRKLLAKSEQYGGFAMDGGALEINATIPEDAYKLYLSVMVLLDREDLDTLEDRELADEVEEIKNILEDLLVNTDTPVDAKMLQSALNKAGMSVDLMQYENYIDGMLNSLKNSLEEKESGSLLFVDGAGSGAGYHFTMQYDMAGALGNFEFDLSEMFATTKLSIPVYINVWNYNSDFAYEALVVDVRGDGVKGKLNYVEDLSEALKSAEGPVYAILLKDINDDITVNCATILDLNGKTINGNVKANAALRIVSRILDIETAGGVTGDVTGSVVVTAGTFADDLGSKVKSGYVQDAETGTVKNTFYNVQDTEEEMIVTISLEQIMAEANGGNLPTVALEMVSDIFLNLDSYASIKVDGNTLYDVDVDIIELLSNASTGDFKAIADQILDVASLEELKALANNVADDLTDVKQIAKVLKDGGVLSSYTYEVAPWKIKPTTENGEFKVSITSGDVKTKTITMVIEPLSAEQKATLKKLYAAIDEMVSVTNRTFDLGSISFVDGDLKWTGKAAATVTFDLSGKAGEASDYVTALSIILANNSNDKANFVRDIKLYHNNEWSKNLEARYNALTIGDLVEAVNAADGKFLDQMIREVGLTGELEDVEELTSAYDAVLYVTSKLAAAVERLAGNTAFFDKPVNGLFDGETGTYSHISLTVALKLFDNDYASKAQAVIDMINSLPAEFDAENFDEFLLSGKDSSMSDLDLLKLIDAIETAFAALSADAQEIVKANCDYGTVERVRIYLEYDHRAARVVARMIDSLPHMFSDSEYAAFLASGKTLEECECCDLNTEEVRAAVIAARAAFDALGRQLGAGEQEWVKANCDFSKLINGEDYFNRLDLADLIALLKKLSTYALDMDALDIFSATLYDEVFEMTVKADVAYNALSESAKAAISAELVEVLENAVAYFTKWNPVLQNVIDLILALPAVPAEEHYQAYLEAKNAYEALYPNSKAYVAMKLAGEYAKMEEYALFFSGIYELIKLIDALPVQFGTDEYALYFCENFDKVWNDVKTADALWDVLGVDNNDDYLNALGAARITKLNNARWYFQNTAVLKVIAMIEALPEEFNVEYYEEFLARGGELDEDFEEVLNATANANDAFEDLVTAYLNGSDAKDYIEGKYEVYQKLMNALDYFADRIGLWITEIYDEDIHYTGKAIKPAVRVYEGAKRLVEKVDYTVNYKNNIKAFELSDYEAAHEATEAFRAQANADGIIDKTEQKTLKTLEGAEKKLMNKVPAVVVNFKKNYGGSAYRFFNIHKIDLAKAYEDAEYRALVGLTMETDVYAAAGKAKAVAPVITQNGKKVSTSEITVTLQKMLEGNWVDVVKNDTMVPGGEYRVLVEARGDKSNFKNAYAAVQHVDAVLMSKATIGKIADMTYTGEELKPEVVVKFKNQELVKGVHYEVSYENNVNVGTAKVIISGIEGSGFTGTKIATFKITGIKLTTKMINMGKITRIYNGEEQLLEAGVDYTLANGVTCEVSYTHNINKGMANAFFTGTGNYAGTIKKTFLINAVDLNAIEFDEGSTYDISSVVYEKLGVTPSKNIMLSYNGNMLKEGKDYTVSFKNNKAAYSLAAYEAAVKAAEEFKAQVNADGVITSAEKTQLRKLENAAATMLHKAPTVTIKGKGNFTGTLFDSFEISKANLSIETVAVKDVQWKDRAGNFKTAAYLTDINGKKLSTADYSKAYTYYYDADPTEEENWVALDLTNKNAQVPASVFAAKGYVDMKVVVSATENGNYTGEVEGAYRLYANALTKAKIDRNTKVKFIYDRYAQEFVGEAAMKLWSDSKKTELLVQYDGTNKAQADYEIVYVKNIFVGSAVAEIRGLNEFGNSKKVTFRIEKNTEAVADLDNRVNYFNNIEAGLLNVDNLVVYEATPIFEF
ncbi:MAG: hypothetical protein IKU72_02495 [Oscillospiraceae bacterium]|nr:hypothetical protein [Oscillospiraceae bacterium]